MQNAGYLMTRLIWCCQVAIVVSRLPHGSLQWTDASVVSQRQNYSNQNPVLFHDNQSGPLYHDSQSETLYHDSQSETLYHASVVSQRQNYSDQNPVLFHDNQSGTLYLFHTQQDAKKGEGNYPSSVFGVSDQAPRL